MLFFCLLKGRIFTAVDTDNITMIYELGKTTARVDRKAVEIDVKSVVNRDGTFVPENLDLKVGWNQSDGYGYWRNKAMI